MNAGTSSRSFSYASAESRMGVAPPTAAGTSQKKRTRSGKTAHCASSWWNGMARSGGASFAVKTRSPTTRSRTAFPPAPSYAYLFPPPH